VANWRSGGGPARRPQQVGRATAGANPRGRERATAQASGVSGAGGGSRASIVGRAREAFHPYSRTPAL
jgi:hypothetical protein